MITVHFVYSFSADLINIDVSLNVLCVVFISFAKNPYMTNLCFPMYFLNNNNKKYMGIQRFVIYGFLAKQMDTTHSTRETTNCIKGL